MTYISARSRGWSAAESRAAAEAEGARRAAMAGAEHAANLDAAFDAGRRAAEWQAHCRQNPDAEARIKAQLHAEGAYTR